MPASQKVVPSSPNSSSVTSFAVQGDQSLDGIILSSFKLKPSGTGATRNTRVENDSLSSYSWPEEETNKKNGPNQQPGLMITFKQIIKIILLEKFDTFFKMDIINEIIAIMVIIL